MMEKNYFGEELKDSKDILRRAITRQRPIVPVNRISNTLRRVKQRKVALGRKFWQKIE